MSKQIVKIKRPTEIPKKKVVIFGVDISDEVEKRRWNE